MSDLHTYLRAALARGGATYSNEKHTQEQLEAIWKAANDLDCSHRLICQVLRIDDVLQYDAKGVPLQLIVKVIVEPQQPGIAKVVGPTRGEVDILRLPGRTAYLAFREYQDSYGKLDAVLCGWVQAENESTALQKVRGNRRQAMTLRLVEWEKHPEANERAVQRGEWS